MLLKVFLVEDETVIREGLRDRIPWDQFGYRFVGEAADGEMALPLIRKTRPDVLITDIKMPFMDGLSLSKIVSKEFPRMKIIIVSGYDDFEYARQAIEVGVEQYLLKPVTRMKLKTVLLELKDKIERDQEQEDYRIQFQNEIQEYEQFSRRRFMEKILEGELSVKEIYDEAARQSVELTAAGYNLLFLYLQEQNKDKIEGFLRKQNEVLHYFLRYPQYLLFRWNVNSYGVLIKGEMSQLEELAGNCIDYIERICSGGDQLEWYVAVGKPVERLSLLPQCYQSVNHYFAYRFMVPGIHVLTEKTLENYVNSQGENQLNGVDSSQLNPEIIKDFLMKGDCCEIQEFVQGYLGGMSKALESRMFRDYVVLHVRFTAMMYLEALGVPKEAYTDCIDIKYKETSIKTAEVAEYCVNMLQAAIHIRDQRSESQGTDAIRKALDYINANCCKESISLNEVASAANMSANYFSAIFSQKMQKTFVEYITGKRMEHAKKLLRETDKSSGEIAQEVGYKDPHYFSYVFKKNTGCSPREYRSKSST